MLLVELQSPRVVVELGTQFGVSYCAFCQAVMETSVRANCYAVDTWTGDGHAGFYGDDVYENLKAHHKQYESFSQLLRMNRLPAVRCPPSWPGNVQNIILLISFLTRREAKSTGGFAAKI